MPKKKNYGQLPLPNVEAVVEAGATAAERPNGMPSVGMIKTETTKLGLPASDAEYLYDFWLANGFTLRSGKKVRDWKAAVRIWQRNGYFPSQKRPNIWLELAKQEAAWKPPTKEAVMAWARTQKKLSLSHCLKGYRYLVGRNWVYFGVKITSNEQWQALMQTEDFE